MLTKIVNGKSVVMTEDEETAVRAEWATNDATAVADEAANGYKRNRIKIYPPLGDQFDLIYKTLVYLKANGTILGTDGDAWLTAINAVKTTYPKPT